MSDRTCDPLVVHYFNGVKIDGLYRCQCGREIEPPGSVYHRQSQAQIAEQNATITDLLAALEWYADRNNYDEGRRARAALAAIAAGHQDATGEQP